MRGFNHGKRKSTLVGVRYAIKSVASAAANPGSEPKIPPVTPSAVQANSSNVVGTTQQGPGEGNESTIGKHEKKNKFKYKYKYESDRKRKRPEEGGVDEMHMQQKALPGEQYRGGAAMRVPPYKKRPKITGGGIEPRGHLTEMMQKSEAGDQYAKGSTTNNPTKQKSSAKSKGGAKSIIDSVDWAISGAKDIANGFKSNPLYAAVPEGYKAYIDQGISLLNTASSSTKIARQISPELESYVSSVGDYLGKAKDLSEDARKYIQEHLNKISSYTQAIRTSDTVGRLETKPKNVGNQPGESSVPKANANAAMVPPAERDVNKDNEGVEPAQAYSEGNEKAMPGGDPNRLDPITPATGSRQTPASANSIVSVRQLKAAAEHTARTLGPEAVHGNARERANMGKGALDTHEFQGPYDYPIYPGGRPDDSLTMMGAWRTDGGNDSSLWYSKKTAKGANAKRNKYFKWSMKGGGRWRKMSKDEMVNVIQKGGQNDNRFYGTRTGLKFTDFQRQTLSNRDRNVMLGKIGNAKVVESEHGNFSRGRNKYIDANKVPVGNIPAPALDPVGEIPQGPKEGADDKKVGLTGGGGEFRWENIPDDFDFDALRQNPGMADTLHPGGLVGFAAAAGVLLRRMMNGGEGGGMGEIE